MKDLKKRKIKKLLTKVVDQKVEIESFDVWFYRQVKVGKLRSEQKPEIKTFFRKQGLTEIEDSEKYNEIIKYY